MRTPPARPSARSILPPLYFREPPPPHLTENPNRVLPVADQPNLRFEPDAALLFYLVARHVDQRAHVGGLCAAKIHDKIRVLIRKRRTAQPRPLKPRAFQQFAGKISRRILEDRSRIRHATRLSRCTLGLQLGDSRRQAIAIAARKFEIDPRDYEMAGQLGAPVCKLDLILRQRERLASLGHAMHQRHHLSDFARECARDNTQAAAHRAGNTFAEFEPLKTLI